MRWAARLPRRARDPRLGVLGLLSLLVLVAVACQPAGARPSATASPAGSLPPALRAADSKMFAGDYEGAERAYRELSGSGTPGAASHYAVLLCYESRFPEALAQAAAGVAAFSDSASLARQARAFDWAGDLPSALAAGARAVAARPVDPLAHVYYSEALSDAGRYAEAQGELGAAAQAIGSDTYAAAELEREWANFYRDRGDHDQELNHLQLSLKQQPAFPERRLELARYLYAQKRRDAARSVLEQVRKSSARSLPVLLGAGDAAFLSADFDRAGSLYGAADQLQPGLPASALRLAELDVVVKRDFRSAHDRLLAALEKDNSAADAYLFLRYLDLLLLKTDPDQDLNAIGPEPAQLGADRKAVLDRVNATRSALGLPSLSGDAAVAEGAEAHAYYFLFNAGQPQLNGLGIHQEDGSLPGFTGADSLARSRHFGYPGTASAEVINHAFSPVANVRVWLDSVYHRFPLISRDARSAGYGQARVGLLSISVLDLGLDNPPGGGEAIVYPADGQKEVPASFLGNELPDPAPPGTRYPVGYPVTLELGGASRLSVATGRLLGPDGQEVAAFRLDPGKQVAPYEWALLPQQPLRAGATYTAEVTGTLDGASYSRRWSFTVAGG